MKKKHIFHFAGYFALFVNELGCGYAHFQGAVHTFSEHQKNRNKIENLMRKLNFSVRPWGNLGKCMNFD